MTEHHAWVERTEKVAGFFAADSAETRTMLLRAPPGYGKSVLLRQLSDIAPRMNYAPVHLSTGATVASFANQVANGGFSHASSRDANRLMEAVRSANRKHLILVEAADKLSAAPALRQILQDLLDGADNGRCDYVLASFARPELNLSSARARGQLISVGRAELSLSIDEVRDTLAPHVDDPSAVAVYVQTLGWPLVVGQLRDHLSATDRVDALPGHDWIAPILGELCDAIHDDLIDVLPPVDAQILLESSVLGRIPPSLRTGDGVTRNAVVPDFFRDLDPLVRLIPGSDRLDFNPALQRALANIHASRRGGQSLEVHLSAAYLLHKEGRLHDAIDHARMAGRTDLMTNWFRDAGGPEIGLRHGTEALRALLKLFPIDLIESVPELSLSNVLLFVKDGNVDLSRMLLVRLRKLFEIDAASDETPALNYYVSIIDELLKIYEDKRSSPEDLEALANMVDQQKGASLWSRGIVANILCMAYFHIGDMNSALRSARHALDLYATSRTRYSEVYMHVHCAAILSILGEMTETMQHIDAAVSICETNFPEEHGLGVLPLAIRTELLFDQGDVETAQTLVDDVLNRLDRYEGWVELFIRAYETAVRLALLTNDVAAARAAIERGMRTARSRGLDRLSGILRARELELLALYGHEQEVDLTDRLEEAQLRLADPETTYREHYAWTCAFAAGCLALNHPEEAREPLRTALGRQRKEKHAGFSVRTLAMLALVQEDGDAFAADQTFADALSLAAEHDSLRGLLDNASLTRAFARRFLKRGAISGIDRAATALLGRMIAGPERPAAQEVSAILSERERAVLLQLSQGASNKHIARSLDVTEATIKFHVRNIFDKLGVRNRVLAIEVARHKGLLGQ